MPVLDVMAPARGAWRLAAVCAAVACAAWDAPAVAQQATPRNLLIELRQVEDRSGEADERGLEAGGVVVRSDGRGGVGMRGGLSGGMQVHSSRGTTRSVQQVRVMSGMSASVRLGQSVPLQLWQTWLTPQGVQMAPTTVFVEAGQGFTVRPSWPGGATPVRVEVSSESSQLSQPGMASRWERAVAETRAARGEALPPGTVESSRVLTTLAVPLGQWVTLAESGSSAVREEHGLLSTGQLASSRGLRVEMRVTAP